jgi:hypothetical protein
MAAGILGLRQIGLGSLFLELPLAVIIYFASLYVLGGVTKQEFSDLLNK